ncbi:MAG: rhodanese-like domain-containing protein [Balneolaceae bacterium]
MFNIFTKQSSGLDISVEEFKEKKSETPGIIIDVRTKGEFEDGHLAEVDHQFDLMNGDFEAQLENLDKDETYYLYCRTGNRSGQAAKMMQNKGFENVYNIGGFSTLANSGLETK